MDSQLNRFDGKVALVTGAAAGIGRATSLRLASEGAAVVGVDVNEEGLIETAKAAADAGDDMVTRGVDITDRSQCLEAVGQTVSSKGRLDVVCNVAGVLRSGYVTDVTEEDWNLVMGVNVAGSFWMCQAAIPHLLETGGNIVNVASNAGLMGQAYTVPYCASKGAVIQMTRALAMEFAKDNIRVNCIAPGGTETGIVGDFAMPEGASDALVQRYLGFRPMAKPEEIAAAIAFLASDEASNVHGSIFSVDGGLTAG